MSTPMSAAQAAQQNNRGPGGQYSFGTHAEPEGVELGAERVKPLLVLGDVPDEYLAPFKDLGGRIGAHTLQKGKFLWQGPEGTYVTVGPSEYGDQPFTAFASSNPVHVCATAEDPASAAGLALRRMAIEGALASAGFENSEVDIVSARIRDNLVSIEFENNYEESLDGADSRVPGTVGYRIEGSIVSGEFEISARSEDGHSLIGNPEYTPEEIMRRATGGRETSVGAFMRTAMDELGNDKYVGLDTATQMNPPVEEALSGRRDEAETWSALMYLSENSRLHDPKAFDPRVLSTTVQGRKRISTLLEESRRELNDYPLRTPTDRRNHLKNLIAQAKE